MLSRRDLFASALALSISNSLPLRAAIKWTENPFALGVASGDPFADSIVLWTRLAPKPLEGVPLFNQNVEVRWIIAEDEGLKRIARKGKAVATPALAHSVHVEARGLKPERWYWYRFESGGQVSPVGRFRTASAPGSESRLRFAVASCQQWTQGFYTAYDHMAQEELDVVLHLGDYIYEQGYTGQIRPEGKQEIFTLSDYRNRHALYKSDPMLQKAHSRFPFITVWDDHEVSNNYADDKQEKGQTRETFLERRASAYQAYYEHMPLRQPAKPEGSRMQLYRRVDYGKLARFHMLDTRQYRSDQPCTDGLQKACSDMNAPNQTLLGNAQEKWLNDGIEASPAIWNVLGQQIFFTIQDYDRGEPQSYNMDSWSGYPLAQKRVVDSLAEMKKATVILTGDVHASWVAEVHTSPRDLKTNCVAAEFIGTSITSGGDGSDQHVRAADILPENPQILYSSARRGYMRCEVTKDNWRTDYRHMDYVSKPGSPIKTAASYVVQPGNLRPQIA